MGRDELAFFLNKEEKSWAGCRGDGRAARRASGLRGWASSTGFQGRMEVSYPVHEVAGQSRVTSISSQAWAGGCAGAMDLEEKEEVWDSLPPTHYGAHGIFEGFKYSFLNKPLKTRWNCIDFDAPGLLKWGGGDRDSVTDCDSFCDAISLSLLYIYINDINNIYIYI